MDRADTSRLTPAEGRKFAFPVGIAFGLLAGLFFWRGVMPGVWITGSASGLLLVAGLLVPGYLGPVYRAWMGLALLISRVTTPIFMGVVYFLVLTPVSLIMRIVRYDPLGRDPASESYWVERTEEAGRRSDLSRQF
jgi:hypothetical protein